MRATFTLLICLMFANFAVAEEQLPAFTSNIEYKLFQVRPAQIEMLRAISNGRVANVATSLGDEVAEGSLLFRLHVDRLEADLRRALSNYSATAGIARSEQATEAQKLNWETSKTELRELADRFRKQSVIAPFTGIIDRFQVLEGEQVRVGQPLVRVVQTTAMQVRIPIDATTAKPGSEVVVLLSTGRVVGKIVDIIPANADAEEFRSAITNLSIAIIVVENQSRSINDSDLAFLPSAPYAIIPDSFYESLNRNNLKIKVAPAVGEPIEVPITLLGQLGEGRKLIAGPFNEGDRIVTEGIEPNEEGEKIFEAVEGAVLFSPTPNLLTPDQFEATHPALSEVFPELESGSTSNEEVGIHSLKALSLPTALKGLLNPIEYPICLAPYQETTKLLGIAPVDEAYYRMVRNYFTQEAVRLRLGIKLIDDMKTATPEGTIKAFREQVAQINSEFLAAVEHVRITRGGEQEFNAWKSAYGSDVVFTTLGRASLEIGDEQYDQLLQNRDLVIEQRNELLAEYLKGNEPVATLKKESEQLLAAWNSDLSLLLKPEQKKLLADVLGDEKSASPAVSNQKVDNPNTEEDSGQEEASPRPAGRRLPPGLQEQAGSTLMPFLILGGGVLLVLGLCAAGFAVYLKRKKS